MATNKRIYRLNSLLKETIAEVIFKEVGNPNISPLTTVTSVDVSKDLHYAKVYVSIIGDDKERKQTVDALQTAAGYIGVLASKRVVLRHFPSLTFFLDTSVDQHFKIESILKDIHSKDHDQSPDPTTSES